MPFAEVDGFRRDRPDLHQSRNLRSGRQVEGEGQPPLTVEDLQTTNRSIRQCPTFGRVAQNSRRNFHETLRVTRMRTLSLM